LSPVGDGADVRTGSHTAVRVIASLLGGANGFFLVALGGSVSGEDTIFGELGPLLLLAGLAMVALVALAWFSPLAGGMALIVLGGVLAGYGFTFTLQAGILMGGAGLVAGMLFVGSRPQPALAPR
jgi:hypothetical protein